MEVEENVNHVQELYDMNSDVIYIEGVNMACNMEIEFHPSVTTTENPSVQREKQKLNLPTNNPAPMDKIQQKKREKLISEK